MYYEEFRSFVSDPPTDPWEYLLDDHGIHYAPGPWPFARTSLDGKSRRSGLVRLAPSPEYSAANQEYVLAGPTDEPNRYEFDGSLWLRKHGLGADCADFSVTCDQDGGIIEANGIPEARMEAIADKVRRFGKFLAQHRAERDAGRKRPVTAHELYTARQSEPLPCRAL